MSDEAAEKEFDPTPQKLLEARRKGEVIKSADLNTAAAYLGFLICLSFIFGSSIQNLADSLTGMLLLLSFAIGAADYFFQRAEHLRKNRMSRKDIQDELKSAEGDPEMKQRRRQKAMALASNTMLADVSDASVVIVNPTHYAVALQWDPMAGAAPKVVAKGVDEIAMQIRRAAIDKTMRDPAAS